METRRDFLKKAALLSGAAGLSGMLPPSIARAMSIDPTPGSTYMDAEHVVILMQENRSFDHCYGSLQGVRGFNDPRAITLPDKKPVWLQTNADGKTSAPFRLNIKDTRATWMGSLPHSWTNQVDARNDGKYDQWLEAKKAGNPEFAEMPLTLGYYTRRPAVLLFAGRCLYRLRSELLLMADRHNAEPFVFMDRHGAGKPESCRSCQRALTKTWITTSG